MSSAKWRPFYPGGDVLSKPEMQYQNNHLFQFHFVESKLRNIEEFLIWYSSVSSH